MSHRTRVKAQSGIPVGPFMQTLYRSCSTMCRLATKRTEKTKRSKRERAFFETDDQACTVVLRSIILLTDFVNY